MTSVLPDDLGNAALAKPRAGAMAAMGVAALGIVFGDIGTS
jgi:K+ transporter